MKNSRILSVLAVGLFCSVHPKAQRDVTTAKISQIINNSLQLQISLEFGTDFDHLSHDVLKIFKVKWSIVKVTHRLSTKLLLFCKKSKSLNITAM